MEEKIPEDQIPESVKTILGLKLPSDPRWADAATKELADILTDHAYCEQKAASTCISIIVQYPDKEEIVEKLAPLVTEEWGHFRLVLRELKRRNLPLGPQRKDEYVNALLGFLTKQGNRDYRLMDKLLMAGLIEARSCERFKLLSKSIQDEDLSKFYYDLMASEAGHYRLFLDLAKTLVPDNMVQERWQEWLDFERELMSRFEPRPDRMH